MDRDQLIAEIKKQLQEELKDYTRPLTDKISDEHKDQAVKVKNEVTNFVQGNPLLAMGLSLAAGLILGRLLFRNGEE